MRVLSLHPGVTDGAGPRGDRVPAGRRRTASTETAAPTAEELAILREEVDPAGYILRRGG